MKGGEGITDKGLRPRMGKRCLFGVGGSFIKGRYAENCIAYPRVGICVASLARMGP